MRSPGCGFVGIQTVDAAYFFETIHLLVMAGSSRPSTSLISAPAP
jgi:hypothetical protein